MYRISKIICSMQSDEHIIDSELNSIVLCRIVITKNDLSAV